MKRLTLYRFIASLHFTSSNIAGSHSYPIQNLSDTELSDSEPIRFRTYPIPNLYNSKRIRFRTYPILDLSDSEPIQFRTYSIRFRTSLIPQSPLPLPAHNDHQPLLARPVAKLGTKPSTPVPSPPLSSR
jgi:hypothetical protein